MAARIERTVDGRLDGPSAARALRSPVVECFCVKCGQLTRMFKVLVDEPECLCLECANKGLQHAHSNQRVNHEWFARRLKSAGLADQTRIVETLRITAEVPDPNIHRPEARYVVAIGAAIKMLRHPKPGTLILSGYSGSGKSTAAAWAAWTSHGIFLPRSKWTQLPIRTGRDQSELTWISRHGGVVVLDDCLHVKPGGDPGDSEWEAEVIFRITQERHESGFATILTTQADRREIETSYGTRGEALTRRAADGQDLTGHPNSGGWVDCFTPRPKGEPHDR
jgi:DNA replication protein DnaC